MIEEEEIPIRYCPDCGYNLAANVHAIMHAMWQQRQPTREEPETPPAAGVRFEGNLPSVNWRPDGRYNLANIQAPLHEKWQQRQKGESIQEEPETVTVEVVYQGKRYRGIIPCIGLEEEEEKA